VFKGKCFLILWNTFCQTGPTCKPTHVTHYPWKPPWPTRRPPHSLARPTCQAPLFPQISPPHAPPLLWLRRSPAKFVYTPRLPLRTAPVACLHARARPRMPFAAALSASALTCCHTSHAPSLAAALPPRCLALAAHRQATQRMHHCRLPPGRRVIPSRVRRPPAPLPLSVPSTACAPAT
jgi:hypothetical protein